jgi:trk system potassium uptake protein
LARKKSEKAVLVLGLGRFGGALARTLTELGGEVLGVDEDPRVVQDFSGRITHAAEADSTDIEALRQLGVNDFSRAVVAMGAKESSILTTAILVDLGVDEIWAKAVTEAHGKILERVGAHHVVFPERDVGERLAHVVAGRIIDFLELDPGFALVKTKPPAAIVGKALGETGVRKRFGITVVCIKPEGEAFTYATQDTVVGPNDILVVAGATRAAEGFGRMT